MTYQQTLDFLFGSLPVFQNLGAGAYKPGLEHIAGFCRSLGDPQRRFPSVHVAGTNGKGSVSHMLASVLMRSGLKTGLFTSPHLLDFRERIRIDGRMISREEVTEFTGRHREQMLSLGLTFFEMTTALAFDCFARHGVDIAVIETGLGGRLDSTNIITPLTSVITNIGLEHTALLGGTIAAIAGEKAGIIKPGVEAVIGEEELQSAPVFRDRAARCGAPLTFAERSYRYLGSHVEGGTEHYRIERLADGALLTPQLDLLGIYQHRNILTALTAADALRRAGVEIPEQALCDGLAGAARTTGLAGRWQRLGERPLTVCDTGHNAHGLRYVAEQLRAQRYRKLYFVLGVVNDKDLSAILPLLPADAHYLFTQTSVQRALPAGELARRAGEAGLRGETVPGVAAAVARARELASPEDMIFIGGSTFTVAEIGSELFAAGDGGREAEC